MSTIDELRYCECRWPRWDITSWGEPSKYGLYCAQCHKVASPLVYELISYHDALCYVCGDELDLNAPYIEINFPNAMIYQGDTTVLIGSMTCFVEWAIATARHFASAHDVKHIPTMHCLNCYIDFCSLA